MAFKTTGEYRRAWDAAYTTDPSVPLNIDIELASACNAACPFCLYGDSAWSSSMRQSDFDGRPRKRFMPTEMALAIIAEAHRLGVPALKFNFRGESTLHPDFSAVLNAAASCAPAFHELLVNTNGNCPGRALDGLMRATKVMVSLDSFEPATYAKMRVGLRLGAAIETVNGLLERGHKNIWVRRVISKDNLGEDFVGEARRRWGTAVHVSEHYAFDRNREETKAVHGEAVGGWERTYCGYPSQRLVVTASGAMLLCCLMWEDEYLVGRFPERTIEEAWASPERAALVKALRANDLAAAPEKCRNCTSFMAYKRPERDFVQDKNIA